jgi:ribosomal protein L11 methyltransferase
VPEDVQEHVEPVEVASGGRRLRVRPPWAPAGGARDVLEVVIEPPGLHPTTRLCLELLLELDPAGGLCEWGAGSGVVAVVAARLGFTPVAAVAPDDAAVEAIARNAVANGVAVRALRADMTVEPPPWAPTVAASLEPDVLGAVPLERPPERLIAAGMLEARAGEAAEAFARHGLVEAERRVQAGWAAVLLVAA